MKPERKPGRPPADGIDQRERLLDSAVRTFAARGIAGTSLRGLARDAHVTPAMLNYYFGSKDRLVDSVVQERVLPILVRQKESLAAHTADDCVSLISAFVSGLHKTIDEHPWLPGLWVREVLTEGGQLRSILTGEFSAQLPRPLAKRFAQGQADGEINAELDPRLLFVSLIGLTFMPFAAAPIWHRVFDASDVTTADMLAHTLALLTQGIRT